MVFIKNLIDLIFGLALFINAGLFIPQAYKIFKEKTAAGISLFTFIGFILIQIATILYGIINSDYILIAGYVLSVITCGSVVILALIYKKNKKTLSKADISPEEILEQTPGHIYWKDKNGIFAGCNTNNWRDFGLQSLADYIGKTDYDCVPRDQAEHIRSIDREVMQTGKLKIAEEPCTTKDGKTVIYLSQKMPLRNKRGEVIGIIGSSFDITK